MRFPFSSFCGLWLSASTCTLFGNVARAEPISGRVVDDQNRPVADARVFAEREFGHLGDDVLETRSDETGNWTLDLKDNPTWPDRFGRAVAFKDSLAPAGLNLKRRDNNFVLGKPREIAGRVIDENGKGVSEARVRVRAVFGMAKNADAEASVVSALKPKTFGSSLWVFGPLENWLATKTDAQGHWKIARLPQGGQTQIALDDPRFERDITSSEDATVRDFKVKPGATLTGRVLNEAGRALANIKVSTQSLEPSAEGHDRTVSDAQGNFTLQSLPAGRYNVLIDDASRQRVAIAPENIGVKAGKIQKLPDIALTPGATIEGNITDETGAPLRGVQIGSHGPHRPKSGAAVSSATSDDKGRYVLRVAPGDNEIYVMGKPDGLFYPENGSPSQTISLQVLAGEKARRDWVLERGATVALQVLAGGKAVPDAKVLLTGNWPERDYSHQTPTATTDEKGVARFVGLRDGTYTPVVEGAWQLSKATPVVIAKNASGRAPLALGVTALPLIEVKGRVLTPAGVPIEGANVTLHAMRFEQSGDRSSSTTSLQAQARSDAQGRFTFTDLPPQLQITLDANKARHRAKATNVKIKAQNGEFPVTEIVLSPLEGAVRGTVKNARGEVQSGVQVLAVGGEGAPVATDAQGQFALKSLPLGRVRVMAGQGAEWAETLVEIANDKAQANLVLQEITPDKERDVWRGREWLETIKAASREEKWHGRRMLAMNMVEADWDLAIELATEADGGLSDEVRTSLIARLARVNPSQAALIAPEQIALIKNSAMKFYALSRVGQTLARTDMPAAQELWTQLETLNLERKRANAPGALMEAMMTAMLAVATNQPNFATYIKAAQAFNGEAGEGFDLNVFMAPVVARTDAVAAEEILVGLNEARLVTALKMSIRAVAQTDTKTALRWLDWLRKTPKTPPVDGSRYQFEDPKRAADMALVDIIEAMKDPDGALKMAREVTDPEVRMGALWAASHLQKPEFARELWREIAENNSQKELGWLAAVRVGEFDAMEARKVLGADDKANFSGTEGVRRAFHLAKIDRGLARLHLEILWTQRDEQLAYDRGSVAFAMAACDATRAWQMSEELPIENGVRFDVQQRIARWILADASTRREKFFDFWSRRGVMDEDDL